MWRPTASAAVPRIPWLRECARPARRRGGGARNPPGESIRPAVSRRRAAEIRPVRSRPSTAPTSIRASSSADSIDPDLKRAVSARRAASTVCPSCVVPRPSPSSLRTQGPIRRGLAIRVVYDSATTTACGYGSLRSRDDDAEALTPPHPGRRAARPDALSSAHRPVRRALRPRSPAAACRASD